MGSLLVFPAPALPFVCAVNELAALVLLPDSVASVVVGVKVNDCPAAEIDKPRRTGARRQQAERFKLIPRSKGVEALYAELLRNVGKSCPTSLLSSPLSLSSYCSGLGRTPP